MSAPHSKEPHVRESSRRASGANRPAAHQRSEVPVWLKFVVPLGLALLASVLNMAAVQKRIEPVTVLAIKSDVPAGTRLTTDHFENVLVAGNLDKGQLITPAALRVSNKTNGEILSLAQSLEVRPRVVSRDMLGGELLTKSALGGIELPGPGEETVHVLRSKIRGGHRLRPGQQVHFLAEGMRSKQQSSPPSIGPFRVALQDPDLLGQNETSSREATIPIVYKRGLDGTLGNDAAILRMMAVDSANCSLTVMEKHPTAPSPNQNASHQVNGDALVAHEEQ